MGASIRVGGIRWNQSLARYIDARGRIVSTETVRSALDVSLLHSRERARSLASSLRAGSISLSVWEADMRVLVKDVTLYSVAGAHGGWAQLTSVEYGRIGALVREQYDFLYTFAQEIATGAQPLDGNVARRAIMYVDSGRASFERQQEAADRAAGYDEERNVKYVGDNCDECVDETARGWVPIGSLKRIGARTCLSNCRCKIVRRMSAVARAAKRVNEQRRRAARR